MNLLARLLLAGAVTGLVALVAHRTRPDRSERPFSVPYAGGTFSHRAPRIVAETVPSLSLSFRGPGDPMLFTTVTLEWTSSTQGSGPMSPLTRRDAEGGADFAGPELPFDEGAAVSYSFHVRGPGGPLELPAPGQRFVVRVVGAEEGARIRLHGGALLLGVFLATLGGVEGAMALRTRRFERRLTWIATAAAGTFALGALVSVGLSVNRGLGVETLVRIVALAGLWGTASALSLLASARERYLQPCALTCLIVAFISAVVALLPHGFAA